MLLPPRQDYLGSEQLCGIGNLRTYSYAGIVQGPSMSRGSIERKGT